MAGERITGTLAAAVTPLRDGGARLDEHALGALLRFYASTELDGLLVAGTTGEGILLSEQERRSLAELAVAGSGRLRMIVHCGAQTTRETSSLAAHAAEAGADGVAVIGPPYFPLGPAELLEHFAAAAAACAPLPFYVYEYADRTGYAVPLEVIEALRERAANLTGMKVSDAPFALVEPYLSSGLDVFVGAEAVLSEALEAGAAGAVSGLAAVFPEAVAALVAEPTTERAELVNALRGTLSRYPFQAAVEGGTVVPRPCRPARCPRTVARAHRRPGGALAG